MNNKEERLQMAVRYLISEGHIDTQKDIADRMNANKVSISNALKGNEKYLTDKFMERFNSSFGGIFNTMWLIDGIGDMLQVSNKNEITSLEYGDIDFVYLLPLSCEGGTLKDFAVSIKESDCEKIISPIKGADFAMTVSGESMAPEYPNGSKILIKKINEKAFIDWGRVYVLDTCNGSVIKRIVPSEKEGYIKCLSINQSPIFAPFDICMSDIYGVYRVLLCMSMK